MAEKEMPQWKREAIQRAEEERRDYERICAEAVTEADEVARQIAERKAREQGS